MDIVKFASGKEYECPFFTNNATFGTANVAVRGMSFADAATLFSSKDELQSITYGNYVLTGYTKLTCLIPESYGIRAMLQKE